MNDYKIRNEQLEKYKQEYIKYVNNDDIEGCNSIVRHATFLCNHLNLNVVSVFAHLIASADLDVSDTKKLTCEYCGWVTEKGFHSLRAHEGRMHKKAGSE